MRNELNQIEYIEQYLEGKLTVEEQMLFENRLKSDESLRNNTEIQKQLSNRIKVNAFRSEIMNFHVQLAGKKAHWSLKGIWLNSLIGLLFLGSVSASVYYFAGDDKMELKQTVKLASIQTSSSPNGLVVNTITPLTEEEKTDDEKRRAVKPILPIPNIDPNTPIIPVIDIPKDETPCKNFLQPFNSYTIDASKGGDVLTNDSKSVIHFDANILVDKNGNQVKGDVEIRYREYRNSAQTAFSKIPMNYIEGKETYNFNSAGMFEVRAFQNGEELKVKPEKSFNVDYNVTNKVDDCYFFAMDDETKIWRKLKPIVFRKNLDAELVVNDMNIPDQKFPLVGQLFIRIKNFEGKLIKNPRIKDLTTKTNDIYSDVTKSDSGYHVLLLKPGKHDLVITEPGHKKLKLKNINIVDGKITTVRAELAPRQHGYQIFRAKKVGGAYRILDTCKNSVDIAKMRKTDMSKKRRNMELAWGKDSTARKQNRINGALIVDNGNRTNNTLLAENINTGHTYPSLVKGLQCSSFGVYNCDQIVRVADRLAINANYKDADGNTIENTHVLSMIDLQYNGAFSFSPQQFTCSKSGRNVLLLFTNDKKLYALTEEEYKKMKVEESGTYDFIMADITEKVADSEDLKNFLGLK